MENFVSKTILFLLYNSYNTCKTEYICKNQLWLISTCCGGTGTDFTVPTITVQVLITTGTVMDSGSECTDLIGDICRFIYRTGEL